MRTNALTAYLTPKPSLEEQSIFYTMLKRAEDPLAPMSPPQGAAPQAAPQDGGVLPLLAEMITNEFRTMFAYMSYANSLRDLSHHSIAEEFESHAIHEKDHADFLMRRMSVLGGTVNLTDPIPPPPPQTDPLQIIQFMQALEAHGLELWKRLHAAFKDDVAMQSQIEQYMATEQEHSDELAQMMPNPPAPAPAPMGPAPGPLSVPAPKTAEAAPGAEVPVSKIRQMAEAASGKSPSAGGVIGSILGGLGGLGFGGVVGHDIAISGLPRGMPGPERAARIGAGRSIGHAVGGIGGGVAGYHLGDAAQEALGKHLAERKAGKLLRERAMLAGKGGLVGAGLLGAGMAAKKIRDHFAEGEEKAAAEKDPKARGEDRAKANLSAKAEQHKGSRGEQYGDLAGRFLGGAALAAAARKAGKKSDVVAHVAAGALGQHLGGKAGKTVGKEIDAARTKKAAQEFNNPGSGGGIDLGYGNHDGPSMGGNGAKTEKQPMPPEAQGGAEMPDAEELMSYLEQERAGMQQEEAAAAAYHKQRADAAEQQGQQLQQQIQQVTEQAGQLQQQLDSANAQLQSAQQAAVAANEAANQAMTQAVSSNQEALGARQTANDSIRAIDQLKQTLREIADSPALPGSPPGGSPAGGAAGGAPPGGAPGGSPPAASSGGSSAPGASSGSDSGSESSGSSSESKDEKTAERRTFRAWLHNALRAHG